jgi:hypothetical protein
MAKLSEASEDLVRAYRLFFNSPDGLAVTRDLMAFCKFRSPIASEKEEGMRQVFLHILEYSQLTDEQLIALYAGRMMMRTEPQDE